jgi:hypothetical protein
MEQKTQKVPYFTPLQLAQTPQKEYKTEDNEVIILPVLADRRVG